jgi:hypothetical protein
MLSSDLNHEKKRKRRYVQRGFYIEREQVKWLRRISRETKNSMNFLVRDAIDKFINDYLIEDAERKRKERRLKAVK